MPPDRLNPYFSALWDHAAGKPGAVEDHPWEDEPVFKVKGKIFVFLGSSDPAHMTVKAAPDDLDGLLAIAYIEKAPYVGRYGWVLVKVEDDEALDLARELIDTSYEIISRKRK